MVRSTVVYKKTNSAFLLFHLHVKLLQPFAEYVPRHPCLSVCQVRDGHSVCPFEAPRSGTLADDQRNPLVISVSIIAMKDSEAMCTLLADVADASFQHKGAVWKHLIK